jgi:hypothetical protein
LGRLDCRSAVYLQTPRFRCAGQARFRVLGDQRAPDPTATLLPGRVRVCWGVSEAPEAFVTSLAGVLWLGLDSATCLTRSAKAELIMEETIGWHTF